MRDITARTIREAADLLGIPDRASLKGISLRYHDLLREWHPDRSQHDPGLSHEKTILLKESYEILVGYCMAHEISFRIEDITLSPDVSPADYWKMRFGDDPIWG
jgi:DnaJ domain